MTISNQKPSRQHSVFPAEQFFLPDASFPALSSLHRGEGESMKTFLVLMVYGKSPVALVISIPTGS